MTDDIKITDLPDGGCIVEEGGETTHYTKEEIDEMERDYIEAVRHLLKKWIYQKYAEWEVNKEMENTKGPEELLREQLALLAERSKEASNEDLPRLSSAMVEIFRALLMDY